MNTEDLIFYTPYGVISASPCQIEELLGEYSQCWEVKLIRSTGIKKLQPQYLQVGTAFTHSLAEQLSYLQTSQGRAENRARIREYLKELQNGE